MMDLNSSPEQEDLASLVEGLMICGQGGVSGGTEHWRWPSSPSSQLPQKLIRIALQRKKIFWYACHWRAFFLYFVLTTEDALIFLLFYLSHLRPFSTSLVCYRALRLFPFISCLSRSRSINYSPFFLSLQSNISSNGILSSKQMIHYHQPFTRLKISALLSPVVRSYSISALSPSVP